MVYKDDVSLFWMGNVLARGNDVFRVLICDDDESLLTKMKEKVISIFASADIKVKVHTYSDAEQISDQIILSGDIALLDIDFPTMKYNGMDIARRIRRMRNDAIIIFVTNFIEYAPAGYEVQAFRYILKREIDSELEPYLFQAIKQLQSARQIIKIQVNGEIIDLAIDDVLYFEVRQHNVSVYVRRDTSRNNTKVYCIYETLSNLEQQLAAQGFLRIHKSYLVNMRHLVKFQCREATLDNGVTLRVGEKSYSEKKKIFLLWKGWH